MLIYKCLSPTNYWCLEFGVQHYNVKKYLVFLNKNTNKKCF